MKSAKNIQDTLEKGGRIWAAGNQDYDRATDEEGMVLGRDRHMSVA